MTIATNKLVNYIKESKAELKKVIWPTKKETIQHTLLVIGISLGVAAILGALDYVFSWGIEYIINR
jgi:preprotein translocase subunit SecE